MVAKNPDQDRQQVLKDIYRPNRYKLDDQDLSRHLPGQSPGRRPGGQARHDHHHGAERGL